MEIEDNWSTGLSQKTKVLVVDDEPAVRTGLAAWLSQRRFSVLTASNLSSASSAAVKYRPDVILLDVKLGRENGLQLIGLLRAAGLEIPYVVLTAHAGPYDGFKARDLGVVRLIEKPSSPDEIASALRCAVAGHHSTEPPIVRIQLPAGPLSQKILAAVGYIEMHFADVNLTVMDVAHHIDVTPEHLARLFQELLGRKPLIVINDLRIRRAQHFLADPRLNRGEVAARCGYRSTRQLNGWLKFFSGQRQLPREPISRAPIFLGHQETDTNIR